MNLTHLQQTYYLIIYRLVGEHYSLKRGGSVMNFNETSNTNLSRQLV